MALTINVKRTSCHPTFKLSFKTSTLSFKTNLPILSFLLSFQNQIKMDAFRVCSHGEQFKTASEILANFDAGGRQVLLAAQMQSGKTGIFLTLAVMMLMSGRVKRVVIICGSNETELHMQLLKSCGEVTAKYAASQGAEQEAVAARLRDVIEAYKSTGATGLRAAGRIDRETLVIWDESHFAQKTSNLPFKFLQESGLSVSGTERSDELWAAKRSYFLSVSATPFAEYSDSYNPEYLARMCRSIVRHVPSPLYRGVAYYAGKSAIKPAFSVRDRAEDFQALVSSFAAEKKYALVRSRNLNIVKACCEAAGVEYKEYTSKSKELADIDTLAVAPERFTVIGLKGMCRMGKVVPKRYMAFVYEESKQANTDCILQSFLGRMCGHNTEQDPFPEVPTQIYVPECFLKVSKRFGISEMERYLRFTQGEIIMPTKASCLGPKPKTSGRFTLQARWVPFSMFEDDADVDDPEDDLAKVKVACARDRVMKDGMIIIKKGARLADDEQESYIRLALTYLADNEYPDEVQHEFATGVLGRAESTTFVEFPVFTSYALGHQDDLKSAAAAGERFEDSFKDGRKPEDEEDPVADEAEPVLKYFKFYRCVDGFYITGFTDDASPETERDAKAHVVKTTGKEVWNPATDAIMPQTLSIIHTAADLIEQIQLLPVTAQRTLYIHKSLARDDDVAGLVAQIERKAAGGKGGKNWPKSETANKADYKRFVLPAGLILRITAETTTTVVTKTKITVTAVEDGVASELSSTTNETKSTTKSKSTQSIRVACGGAGAGPEEDD